jgi:hypothetical protein
MAQPAGDVDQRLVRHLALLQELVQHGEVVERSEVGGQIEGEARP